MADPKYDHTDAKTPMIVIVPDPMSDAGHRARVRELLRAVIALHGPTLEQLSKS